MKIIWLEDVELEIVNSYDENYDIIDTDHIIVKQGEEDEVDIIDKSINGNFMDIQFGNGSVGVGVPKDYFKIIED